LVNKAIIYSRGSQPVVRVPLVVRGDASFFEKDQLKISGGTQNLFLAVWWYAVEKRLGTPDL